MAKISKEMRMKVVKMAKNMSQRAIVKEFGISKSRISEILPRFQGTGSILNQPGYGCSQNLQHRKVGKLIKIAKAQPKTTARQVMDECVLFSLVSVDTTEHIL